MFRAEYRTNIILLKRAYTRMASYWACYYKYRYPEFKYYDGLPYLDNFYMEVHYMNTDIQNESINRVLSERGKTVYATEFMSGAIIADNGKIKLLGNVKTFEK